MLCNRLSVLISQLFIHLPHFPLQKLVINDWCPIRGIHYCNCNFSPRSDIRT